MFEVRGMSGAHIAALNNETSEVPLAVCEEPYTASTLIPLNIALPGRSARQGL